MDGVKILSEKTVCNGKAGEVLQEVAWEMCIALLGNEGKLPLRDC